MKECYAPAAIRDEFVTALDRSDRPVLTRLAKHLSGCTNPLPGMICEQLELPRGSTYGGAAERVLLMYSTR